MNDSADLAEPKTASVVEPAGVAAAALPWPQKPALPAGLRARLWIEARHFFSRDGAQGYCWLWLLRRDDRIEALRLEANQRERDDLLSPLLVRLDRSPEEAMFCDPVLGRVWRLPAAPVVPLPRWAISWGHPVQQAIRAFAAMLDTTVLEALGRLEVAGPFFGSVTNYNRLAALPQPARRHRLQALGRFPPLVAPVLLDFPGRPDMLNDPENAVPIPSAHYAALSAPLLEAMDRGRDLIGALARHYDVDRALVRSPLVRGPWNNGYAPPPLLRLIGAIPAHARPRRRESLETRLPYLQALHVYTYGVLDTARLGKAFSRGWNAVWATLEARFQPLAPALRDTHDFVRSALEQTVVPEELDGLDVQTLRLAWLCRRGLLSLLEASRRWHAQPVVNDMPEPDHGLPDSVPAVFSEETLPEGDAREIVTHQALIAEGGAMHHCVGDYWTECVIRATRIVHLQTEGGEAATAQYDLETSGGPPRFDLVELRGPCNAAPSAPMREFAEAVATLMNSSARAERREQAIRESVAARVAFAGATAQYSVQRQPLRPLDNRSRRELRLVLDWCLRQKDWCSHPEELFRGRIAGFGYAGASHLLHRLEVGDVLELLREPDNAHDPLAVRVEWHGCKLGYVPRTENAPIAHRLDRGEQLAAAVSDVQVAADAQWSPIEFAITSEKC